MSTDVPNLDVAEVKALLDKGLRPKFIDARDPKAWQASALKIPGAIQLPAAEPADDQVHALPRDRPLIAYGTGHDDDRAAELARILSDRGLAASYLRGGFSAWLGAGLPVARR